MKIQPFFHRNCIENFLSINSICPSCKHPCELVDLKKVSLLVSQNPTTKPTNRNKSRGALAKQHNTRSQTRNLFQDNQLNSTNPNIEVSGTPTRTTQQSPLNSPDRNHPLASGFTQNQNITVDFDQLNKLIETNITRLLTNLEMIPNPNNRTQAVRNINSRGSNSGNNDQNPTNRIGSPVSLNSNFSNLNMDKITSIISSWNIKFDGSPSGLNVEEFLYRIRSLTFDNFNGDFVPIVKNLNVLLTGKAKDWYWRYRKHVETFTWDEFCMAIRCQYRDFKSSFDIREEIRNRKMKAGETFDMFFDSISLIIDRLPSPMSEMELIEILTRNLRPEIRQDLLYVPVHSISHLRKLVQMREAFLNDDHVKKNLSFRHHNNNNVMARRYIAEVDDVNNSDNLETNHSIDEEVNAIDLQNRILRCWNCKGTDHFWYDCLEERKIFCYGCGTENIYKPQCPKCSERRIKISKNLKTLEAMNNPN